MTIHKLPKATSSRGRASGGNALSQSRRPIPVRDLEAIFAERDLEAICRRASDLRPVRHTTVPERIERWFGLPAWQLAIMFAVFAGVCAGIVSL